MKPILMCLLLSASVGTFAQRNVQTFTSPDGVYQFAYPTDFVRCSQSAEPANWTPEDCLGGIPVCPQPEETANVEPPQDIATR